MRIESCFFMEQTQTGRVKQNNEQKTKHVARDVLGTLPNIGLDPVSYAVGFAVGYGVCSAVNSIIRFFEKKDEEEPKKGIKS